MITKDYWIGNPTPSESCTVLKTRISVASGDSARVKMITQLFATETSWDVLYCMQPVLAKELTRKFQKISGAKLSQQFYLLLWISCPCPHAPAFFAHIGFLAISIDFGETLGNQ